VLIERIADHAGLDADRAAADIDLQNAIQMAARIDDNSAPHHLPGQRRACGAGDEADPVLRRILHERADVSLGFGNYHRQRPLLILRRIGRVDRPREVIDEQVALKAGGDRRELPC